MRDWVGLAVYVAGWLITARVLYVFDARSSPEGATPDGFMPTVVGLIWPIIVGVCALCGVLGAVMWLISRPVRRRRWRPFGPL